MLSMRGIQILFFLTVCQLATASGFSAKLCNLYLSALSWAPSNRAVAAAGTRQGLTRAEAVRAGREMGREAAETLLDFAERVRSNEAFSASALAAINDRSLTTEQVLDVTLAILSSRPESRARGHLTRIVDRLRERSRSEGTAVGASQLRMAVMEHLYASAHPGTVASRARLPRPADYRVWDVHPDENGGGDFARHPDVMPISQLWDPSRHQFRDNTGALLRDPAAQGSLAHRILLFVIDPEGQMWVARQDAGGAGGSALDRFLHPQLIGGSNPEVVAAGMLGFDAQGRVQTIFYNGTGHYKTPQSTLLPVRQLIERLPSEAFSLDLRYIRNPDSSASRRPASGRRPDRNDGYYLIEHDEEFRYGRGPRPPGR